MHFFSSAGAAVDGGGVRASADYSRSCPFLLMLVDSLIHRMRQIASFAATR